MASPAEHNAYRRGTVLGLTVAEVFILLLFLLLIALLALARDQEADDATARAALETLQEWGGVIAEFEEPDEVVTLALRKDAAERASERHRKRAETLQQMLDSEDAELAAKVEEAFAEVEAAREAERQARHELHILRTKGVNPPCWYQTVPHGEATREKPYYTFNVAVFDQHMVVLLAAIPPGGADDDGSATFASEAQWLNLDALPYGQPLDDEAFLERFAPVSDAGRSGSVRTYPCIFWARVWDRTSANAKDRWKKAHDGTIEKLFGTYLVKDDPWPGKL